MHWSGVVLLYCAAAWGYQTNKNKEDCGNSQFKDNSVYYFKYSGEVENGISGTSKNVTKLRINAKISVGNWLGCKFYLEFAEVKFAHAVGGSVNFVENLSSELALGLKKHTLLFSMKDGFVTEIQPSIESTEVNILNVQRGVLSMFQVKNVHSYGRDTMILTTDDVSGTCPTSFTIDHYGGYAKMLNKVKDLKSCRDHFISHSNIIGYPYGLEEKSPVLDTSSVCSYSLNRARKVDLNKVMCKERFLVQAFSTQSKAGAYVKSRSKLIFNGRNKLLAWNPLYTNFYTTSIKYTHNHQHAYSNNNDYLSKGHLLINNLANNDYHESAFDSAEKFFDLVVTVRHLNHQNVADLISRLDLNISPIRHVTFDALVQCGTPECLGAIFTAMKQLQMHSEVSSLMSYLPFIKEPSPEVIQLLMGVHQETKNPSAILAFSTLMNKLCLHRVAECLKPMGKIKKVAEDVENYFLSMLGNNCQVTDSGKLTSIYYALKGIGNIGKPLRAVPIIMDCVKNAKHSNISIAAVQALRKMKLPDYIIESLREIFADKGDDFEKRAEIFLHLMREPEMGDIILSRDLANNDEESRQMRSLIHGYLHSASTNKDPSKMRRTELFKDTLKRHPLSDLHLPNRGYSKGFQQSLNIFKSAVSVDSAIFYHPESFVPRSMKLNLTTHMFGFSVNALEIDARFEGLEMLLGKHFGKSGYFSNTYLQKIFKIPEEELTRKRRDARSSLSFEDINKMVNMKQPSPQALLSLRVFGNDVHVFQLEDLPFLNGDFENLNVIKMLYDWTKGKQLTLKRNMVLFEASHSVPTMLGFPLNIGINASTVVTMDFKGKLNTKNLLFGPKIVTMHGTIHPSASTYISGKLNIECFGAGDIGTTFQMNAHVSKRLEAKLDYAEGKELKMNLNAEKQVNDVFNVSYNMYHLVKGEMFKMAGVEKRASAQFCSDDMFNSTKIFGSNTCIDMSFPNTFYNFTTPRFPLTGPASFGVRNFPTDPLLKNYEFSVRKSADLYNVEVSTPGASSERKYTMTVGLTRRSDSGVIALLFGEQKKGVTFKYRFHNITNAISSTITSNFTHKPLELALDYFNNTDPFTLEREVGETVKFKFGRNFINHIALYKSNYEFWESLTTTEYSPGQSFLAKLRIQYDPQVLEFNLSHPSTETWLGGYLKPLLPNIAGQINFTHANTVFVRSFGEIDISMYRVKGAVSMYPQNQHVKATGWWEPQEKKIVLDGEFNGEPVKWNASFKNFHNSKHVCSVFNISKLNLMNMLTWNRSLIDFRAFVSDRAVFSIKTLMEKTNNSMLFNISSGINGTSVGFALQYKNSSEMCLHGYLQKSLKFGYCVKVINQPGRKEISYDYLSKQGNWEKVAWLFFSSEDDLTFHFTMLNGYGLHFQLANKTLNASLRLSAMNFELLKTVDLKYDTTKFTVVTNFSANRLEKVILYRTPRSNEPTLLKVKFSDDNSTIVNHQVFVDMLQSSYLLQSLATEDEPLYSVMVAGVGYRGFKSIPLGRAYVAFHLNTTSYEISRMSLLLEQFEVRVFPHKVSLLGRNGTKTAMLPLADFSILNNGSVILTANKENLMSQKFVQMLETNKQSLFGIIVNNFKRVFSDVVDEDGMQRFIHSFKGFATEYFSSFTCNGFEAYENHLRGLFHKDLLVDIALKLACAPYANSSKHGIFVNNLLQSENWADTELRYLFQHQMRNLGSLFNSNELLPNLLNRTLFSVTRLTSVDKDYILFLQRVADVLHSVVDSHLNKSDIKRKLASAKKHFPTTMKVKFNAMMMDVVESLHTWKFNASKTLLRNSQEILSILENLDEFLFLEYDLLILKNLLHQVSVPADLASALKMFTVDSHYVRLASKVSQILLRKLKVQGNRATHVRSLLREQSIGGYLRVLSDLVVKRSLLTTNEKRPFREYLDNGRISIMVDLAKKAMKKFGFPKTYVNLVTNILNENDAINNQLRLLPTFSTFQFYPEFFVKVLNSTKHANMDMLVKFVDWLPEEASSLKQHLKTVLSRDSALIDRLMGVYEIIIKANNLDGSELDTELLKLVVSNEKKGEKIKTMVIKYYDTVVAHLKAKLLPEWTNNLEDLAGNVRARLNAIDFKKLEQNGTNEISDALQLIVRDLSRLNQSQAIYKYAVLAIKNQLFKVKYHHETGEEIFNRTSTDMNDKWIFLVRLLDQFSSTEDNFASRFVKNDQIKYYAIYKSIWSEYLANKNNIKQVNDVFDAVEMRALREIEKFTSNYSTVATLNNIIYYLKSLNYTDFNSLIDSSYKSVDLEQFKNLSYGVLVNHLKVLLQDIGEIKDNLRTFDEVVYAALPRLTTESNRVYEILDKYTDACLEKSRNMQQMVSSIFHNATRFVKNNEKNKFLAFIMDVLVPGVEAVAYIVERPSRRDLEAEYKQDRILYYKKDDTSTAGPWWISGSEDAYNIDDVQISASYAPEPIGVTSQKQTNEERCSAIFLASHENSIQASLEDSQDEHWLREFLNSSNCDLVNLIADVRTMEKDRSFLPILIQRMHRIVVKVFGENRDQMKLLRVKAKTVLTQPGYHLHDSKHALQKLVFNVTNKLLEAIKDSNIYRRMKGTIRRSINVEKFNLQNIVKTYIVRKLHAIAPKMSIKKLDKLARHNVPVILNRVKMNLRNASLVILQGIDRVKEPLSIHPVIRDPVAYIESLPGFALSKLEGVFDRKSTFIVRLHAFETKIRKVHSNALQMLQGLSHTPDLLLKNVEHAYRNATARFFDQAIGALNQLNADMSSTLSEIKFFDSEKNLKEHLDELTTLTRRAKKKFLKLKRRFIKSLTKNITRALADSPDVFKTNLSHLILSGVNISAFHDIASYLEMSVREMVFEFIHPQLNVMARHLDAAICEMKRTISRFYSVKGGNHTISWKQPGFYDKLVALNNSSKDLLQKLQLVLPSTAAAQKHLSLFDFVTVKSFVKYQVQPQVKEMIYYMKEDIRQGAKFYQFYRDFADGDPVVMVDSALRQYQKDIMNVAYKLNNAISIAPPTNFERPIIRFLGVLFGIHETKSLKPISRTAYIFENSIVTYDGKVVFIPSLAYERFRACKYLLTRDMIWNNFTIYLEKTNFVVDLVDARVVVDRTNSRKVDIFTKTSSNAMRHSIETPAQMTYTTVTRFPDALKIESLLGLLVVCRLDVFACNVTVSGYYHNKTLGLFGTNNLEYSDEFRMPNGQLAVNIFEFLNALETSGNCHINDQVNVFSESVRSSVKILQCSEMMTEINTKPKSTVTSTLSSAFSLACSAESNACDVSNLFVNSLAKETNVQMARHPLCVVCHGVKTFLRFENRKSSVRVTLLVKLVPTLQNIVGQLKTLMRRVNRDLKREYALTFVLVGFNGLQARRQPHLQTGGGHVVMSADGMKTALNSLVFDGQDENKRFGLAALKFASEFSQNETNLFFLFDDDIAYTNSLLEMMDTYRSMDKRAVILNVVNKYKLKRNVIGKDSVGMRYHIRLPLGEHLRAVQFPPPDDYIPLVKQTYGAVFTLNAFTSSNPTKWSKSLQVSVVKAFRLQIQRDRKLCKECHCSICRNVGSENCDYGA